ncbi:MAG: hypothetical protein Q7Q73_13420 [Verrucomicrobiota bacterium JB024]|nr:hypothetical protein [Verrucomicrobiota bacterium JB024]
MKKILFASLCLSVPLISQAAIVATWEAYQGNITGDLSTHELADNMDTGSGLNAISRNGVTYFNKNFTYSSTGWNTTDELVVDSQYLSFSLSAVEGYQMELTDLEFYINGGNPSPGTGMWGYTTDGGSTWTFSDPIAIQSNAITGSAQSWDFEDFTVTGDKTVEFRFWAYGTTNVAGNPTASPNTAPISIFSLTGGGNDIILSGAVTQIPEASTYAWLAGAGAMIALLVRRLRRR